MKISIISPNLSSNCLGRSYLLAKLLDRSFEVEIVGPNFDGHIWQPCDTGEFTHKTEKVNSTFDFFLKLPKFTKEINGDVIYIQKPLITSQGIGLLKKMISRRPTVIDIDDWEIGFVKDSYKDLPILQKLKNTLALVKNPFSYHLTLLAEKWVSFADEITISNKFLKKRYGGTVIWHGRDTNFLDPNKFNKEVLKNKYGIEKDSKIIMFLGTPRAHKGVEDLVEAVAGLKNNNIKLALVGMDKRECFCGSLMNLAVNKIGENFLAFPQQVFQKIPEFLSFADIVVIPQRKNLSTVGQLPAKVFDAMAMAKPIIATDVSDLPEILDGCGYIVEAGSTNDLSTMIQYILDNPVEAELMGIKAREKCKHEYSCDILEKKLANIFSKYE